MATILVKGGRVWDGDNFFDSDVLIEGSKIAKIEPNIIANATCVYDATGKTVSAGLVDIHTHLRVTGNEPYGIQGEMACFPFGVTAAADAGRYKGERIILDSFMLKNVIFAGTNVCENHADLNKLLRRSSTTSVTRRWALRSTSTPTFLKCPTSHRLQSSVALPMQTDFALWCIARGLPRL